MIFFRLFSFYRSNCRQNVVGAIPCRTVNNTIYELVRLQQQQLEHEEQQSVTKTTTKWGTYNNSNTATATVSGEPTNSTTRFFSPDVIQSYHERVRDAPPERTIEVMCSTSSSCRHGSSLEQNNKNSNCHDRLPLVQRCGFGTSPRRRRRMKMTTPSMMNMKSLY